MVESLTDIDIDSGIGECQLRFFDDVLEPSTLVLTGHPQTFEKGFKSFPQGFGISNVGFQFPVQIKSHTFILNHGQELSQPVRGAEHVLFYQTNLLEEWFDYLVGSLDGVMHPIAQSDPCHGSFAAADQNVQIFRNRRAALAVQVARRFVTNPAMNTSPTTENPQQMLKAKIFPQGSVDNFARYGHELPTFGANIRLIAACSNLVVIRHIDIEYQFTLDRFHYGASPVIFGPHIVDCANVDLERVLGANFLLELGLVFERLVPDVDVVL